MKLEAERVIIPNGASLSNSIDLRPRILVAVVVPSAWTAASMTFSGCVDDFTREAAKSLRTQTGTELTVAVTVDQIVPFETEDVAGFPFVKVRSGTLALPVAQGADREIILLTQLRT